MTERLKDRDKTIDRQQSDEYSFPYHYLPSMDGPPYFSRLWRFAPSYLAALHLAHDWLRNVRARERDKRVWRHMDFGCGDGGFVTALAALDGLEGIRFSGIDIDERAIEWARMFGSGGGDFVAGDLADLPPGQFDSGSLVEVIEHVPPDETDSFVSSLAASLKGGAELFVTAPSIEKPVAKKHYQHFSFATLRAVFEREFEVLECFGFERSSGLSKLYFRYFFRRSLNVEWAPMSRRLIEQYRRKHATLKHSGRIGLVLRKRPVANGPDADLLERAGG